MALNHKAKNSNGLLCHSNVTEETMSASLRLSLALGLALSLPAAVDAAAPSHHHDRQAYRGTVIYRAAAPPRSQPPRRASGYGRWQAPLRTGNLKSRV